MNPLSAALWGLFFPDPMPEPPTDIMAKGYAKYLSKEKGSFVENKVDKLALICLSMWELLRDRYGLTDEDLLNKTKEIDLRDGVPDGKITVAPKKCSQCGRTLSKRHLRCMYCGSQELEEKPFDLL